MTMMRMLRRASIIIAGVLLLLGQETEATVRIVDSGREYASWPDQSLGPTLVEGQIYKARLQQIKGNSHLCSDSFSSSHHAQNWNVTVPNDGLPVALYVKRGMCSYETKAKHASKYIHPGGVVQFLIIDGDHRHIPVNEQTSNGDFDTMGGTLSLLLVEPPTEESSGFGLRKDPTSSVGSSGYLEPSSSMTPPTTSSFDFVSRALRKKKTRPQDDVKVTVSVLHVSYATGYDLLDLLLREFPSTQEAGGTIIELTGEKPSYKDQQKKTIWFIFVVLLGMSVCLCLLSTISTVMEAAQPLPQTPARPRRGRLTPWQVRNKFLLGVYDGSQVNFAPPKRHSCSRDCENPIGGATGSEEKGDDSSGSLVPSPLIISDNTCTICLDDFNPGDKLRCLPCQHYFHSPCIARWLTERSATCPLCKIDLYESDDEGEEEDETLPGRTPLASSWGSVPPETRTTPTEQVTQPQQAENTETSGERWQRRGRALGNWGRSLFRRRRDSQPQETAPETSLTEPLLPEGNHEETVGEPQVAATQDAAPTGTPESPTSVQNDPSAREGESSSCPPEVQEQQTTSTMVEEPV